MNNQLPEIHRKLGIKDQHLAANKLTLQPQPDLRNLEVVDIDFEGKPFVLLESAANAWRKMIEEALREDIVLKPFSGFRSHIHQMRLIERQLNNGRTLESIFRHIAIPGYSEHHSGRAVDIHAEGKNLLEEDFELTQEFKWLAENAQRFEYQMSYPRDNDQGIIYEPWHWYYFGSSDI